MRPTLTIGIKALNEERHIAAAIESACTSLSDFGGLVILGDCGSTDKTIEIAQTYPIKILTLTDTSQRSCGTGAQLAFQTVDTDYFYLMDGDQILSPEFIKAGIAFLEQNIAYAAVGGRVKEVCTESIEFQVRVQTSNSKNDVRVNVDRLDCGGLYRVDAIRSVGWFSDRNLHSFEEFELGARLTAQGWLLARLPVDAVEHYGHIIEGYRLMMRRIRSGYSGGAGEVLRAAVGRPHLKQVILHFRPFQFGMAVMLWWLLLVGLGWNRLWFPLSLTMLLPILFFRWRRGDFRMAIYSFVSWNVTAVGIIQGIFRKRRSPKHLIPAKPVPTILRPGA